MPARASSPRRSPSEGRLASNAISPKWLPAPCVRSNVPSRTTFTGPSGARRTRRRSLPATTSMSPGLGRHPATVRRGASRALPYRGLRTPASRGAPPSSASVNLNVGAWIALCEQPIERRLVDGEKLGPRSPERSPSWAMIRAAPARRRSRLGSTSEDHRVAGVRMFLLDAKDPLRTTKKSSGGHLAGRRVRPGRHGDQSDPARQIGQASSGVRRTREARRSPPRLRHATRSRIGT